MHKLTTLLDDSASQDSQTWRSSPAPPCHRVQSDPDVPRCVHHAIFFPLLVLLEKHKCSTLEAYLVKKQKKLPERMGSWGKSHVYFPWTLWLLQIAALPRAISGPFQHTAIFWHKESASHHVVLEKRRHLLPVSFRNGGGCSLMLSSLMSSIPSKWKTLSSTLCGTPSIHNLLMLMDGHACSGPL